jgi:hypothetical protein
MNSTIGATKEGVAAIARQLSLHQSNLLPDPTKHEASKYEASIPEPGYLSRAFP